MAVDRTVEWGEDRPVRLIDRLLGDPGTGPARSVSLPAVVCAVIAVALFAVAETLPWMTIDAVTLGGPQEAAPSLISSGHEVSIEATGDGGVIAYYVGVVLLFMIVGATLMSRPHARRALSAAGFGLCAGLLIVIIGLIGNAGRGGDLGSLYNVDSVVEMGPYVAIAAVVAAAGALALSGWHPYRPAARRRPADVVDPDEDEDAEPGPIDLTVTSA
jgi:hypothetical protein